MSLKLTFRGTEEMEAKLRSLAKQMPREVGVALYQEGEEIMTRSKRDFVPVDLGNLRASGHVDEPKTSRREISVTLSYGGPSAPYAAVQHETPHFRHKVGQWKYLERPIRDAASGLADRVAARIRRRID